MLRMPRELILAISSLCLGFAPLHATPDSGNVASEHTQLETRLIELYQRYKDTVVKVKIASKSLDAEGNENVSLTVLSGFFIGSEGTVLTNAIPLNDSARTRVEINGLQYLAIPIAADQVSNLGLIRLAKPPPDLRFVDLDDAELEVELGSIAYGITSPLHFASTPKLGLVTGQESSFQDIEFPLSYTRVSIPSGPAEGGSPVFNTNGRLIGVSVASLPDIESSYLVPTKALQKIVRELKKGAPPIYPTLGAAFEQLGNPATLEHYVEVSQVAEKSSAAQTGLAKGDVLVSFNELPISSLDDLRDAIFYSEIGSFVTLKVRRKDKELEIPLMVQSSK